MLEDAMDTNKEELIRQRAREIWEREGQPEGRATEHWEQAAQEIDAEIAFAKPSAEAGTKGKSAKAGGAGTAGRTRKSAK
jgi:hypothetical protein